MTRLKMFGRGQEQLKEELMEQFLDFLAGI
jgi:hypothetical protein